MKIISKPYTTDVFSVAFIKQKFDYQLTIFIYHPYCYLHGLRLLYQSVNELVGHFM